VVLLSRLLLLLPGLLPLLPAAVEALLRLLPAC
jgi:hypothetical protein